MSLVVLRGVAQLVGERTKIKLLINRLLDTSWMLVVGVGFLQWCYSATVATKHVILHIETGLEIILELKRTTNTINYLYCVGLKIQETQQHKRGDRLKTDNCTIELVLLRHGKSIFKLY